MQKLGFIGAKFYVAILSLPLVVGTLLLFLAASNTLQVTADQTLTQYWRSSYDILVRPQGSRSPIEEEYNLVRANLLSGIGGGITDAQYAAISAIPEVDITAPVAMVGYRFMEPTVIRLEYMANDPDYYGQYRIERTQRVFDGVKEYVYEDVIEDANSLARSGASFRFQITDWERWPAFVAGIDPVEEARLTALDQSLQVGTQSLASFTELHRDDDFLGSTYDIPLLYDSNSAFDIASTVIVFDSETNQPVWSQVFSFGDSQTQPEISLQYRSPNSIPSRSYFTTVDFCNSDMPTSVQYRKILSPPYLPTRSLAFEAAPLGTWENEVAFRTLDTHLAFDCRFDELNPSANGASSYLHVPIGEYDSQQLFSASERLLRNLPIGITFPLSQKDTQELIRSSLNQLPFETYFLPETILKYHPDGTPVSPPVELRPTLNRQGYLTTPPTALTTLEAARLLNNRDDYISAIRVRVGGVGALDAEAQAKIQRVAEQIVAQTGLEVDIMAGTSPKPVYVYLPGYEDIPPLGWVEEQWIQKGVTTAVTRGFRQADLLLSSAVFGVVGLFLVTSQLLSVLGRTRQWGILRALGWRATTLFRTVLQEALLLGLIAGLLALAGGFVAIRFFGLDVPLERLTLLLPVALALYGGGALYPAWRASRMAPIVAVQQGELSGRGGSSTGRLTMTSYGLRHLGQQRLRTALLLMQLTLASALVVLLGAVLLAVQGELYGNLLGQHIYTKVGPTQLAQAALGLLLAALAVAEVLRTSVAERRREIGVLKALGWRSSTLLRAVLSEAALVGVVGGIFGAALGTLAFWALYRQLPPSLLWIVPAGVLLCVAVSMIAALWPALQASRIPPSEAVRYE